MLYARTTIFTGFLLVVLPFLGLPTSWKMTAIIIIGIVLLWMGYKEYRIADRHRIAREDKTKTYTESAATEIAQEHADQEIAHM